MQSDSGGARLDDLWLLALRIVLLAAAVILAVWFAVAVQEVLLRLLLAIILATGLSPLVDRLQASGLPRGPAVLLIYAGLILLLIVLGVAVVPSLLDQVEEIVLAAPTYADRFMDWLHGLRETYAFLPPLDEQLLAQLRGLTGQLGAIAAQALIVGRVALDFLNGVLSIGIVLLITLYLIVDGPRVRNYLLSFVPAVHHDRLRLLFGRMGERMGGWLLGQVALSATIGLASYVGLTLLGVPGAVLLAVVAAIGEAIPMVGPVISAIPAVLVAATQSPAQAIATVVLYVVIQQLENNFLVPKIMERAVRLHPLAVVLSLLIGGQVLGIAGALVAVPVAAALAVALDELRRVPPPVPTALSAAPEDQRTASATPSDRPLPKGSPRA